MKQTCILVLGMHRSGTSALTGVLSFLDVYLGSELIPATEDNEKGYFENNNLNKINEKLLAQIGSSWEDIFFVEDKLKNLIEIKELKEQLKKEFQYSKVFAIKDPRLAFLFPVYKKVLKELDINIKVIIPYRNPVEVARSLNKRDGFIFENSILLWSYHLLLAEKFSRSCNRVFVGFDDLMSSPKNTIKLISQKLDIRLNSKYVKNKNKIKEFLEPNLKHHNLSIDNLSDSIPKIVQDILNFRKQYNDDTSLEKFESLRLELFDYQRLFYNQSIIKTFSNFKQIQQAIIEKEKLISQNNLALEKSEKGLDLITQKVDEQQHELLQTQQAFNENEELLEQRNRALEETKANLTQSALTIDKQKQELTQSQQAFSENEELLEQRDQALEETKANLSQCTLTISKQNLELTQTQQLLNEKEKLLQKKNNELANLENHIEHLKDELVVIYTGRTYKISRFIKKIKGHFK